MDQNSSGGTLTTAPPPPTEVKIRTMKSDLASMAASGGGLPRFENVHVSGLSAAAPESKQESMTTAVRAESKSNLMLIVVLIVILIALAVVGWFVYLKFHG